ncbi:MAG: nuclear transport factor 2 family protein [Pseudobdellovibrionaceae bacterium]
MKFVAKIIVLLIAACSVAVCSEDSVKLENNKKIVREFYDLAFNKHQPLEAANKYLAENYIQHNPYVADGRKGFIDAFANASPDSSTTQFKRFMAEGDLVMIHSHGKTNPDDRGVAVIDIFRVQNNKIVEHWDVGQKIPATSKNNNTMF